jgi:hypothetical protein
MALASVLNNVLGVHCQSAIVVHRNATRRRECIFGVRIEEHKTTMKIEVRKTMNYEDYESTLYSWIFVGTVGL